MSRPSLLSVYFVFNRPSVRVCVRVCVLNPFGVTGFHPRRFIRALIRENHATHTLVYALLAVQQIGAVNNRKPSPTLSFLSVMAGQNLFRIRDFPCTEFLFWLLPHYTHQPSAYIFFLLLLLHRYHRHRHHTYIYITWCMCCRAMSKGEYRDAPILSYTLILEMVVMDSQAGSDSK